MSHHINLESFPPGDYIPEEIEARGWTQLELAEIIGKPLQAVSEIVAGKRSITPEMAELLGAAFGTSAQVWLNLENAYQLSRVPAEDRTV